MLEQILTHIHNWFQVDIRHGTYTIQDGGITLPFLRDGQYFRITGSVFNDGLHRYGPEMELLDDETFDGSIWVLAIPKEVIDLSGEIAAWQEKNGAISMGPYQSESKADYSYSKAVDAQTGGAVTWQSMFRVRLNPYRKLREV